MSFFVTDKHSIPYLVLDLSGKGVISHGKSAQERGGKGDYKLSSLHWEIGELELGGNYEVYQVD